MLCWSSQSISVRSEEEGVGRSIEQGSEVTIFVGVAETWPAGVKRGGRS